MFGGVIMFIEVIKVSGKEYLRLVQSRRKTTLSGKKTSVKEVVFNIGKLEKYDDGQPNYVQRLKQSFRNGTPLIEELLPYTQAEQKTVTVLRLGLYKSKQTSLH